jgi:hypothetical protein
LNPLLNPILSKNIGRWAEVYFTNPPEQREAAVQQLIRDLEREGTAAEEEPRNPVHSLRREDWTIRTAPAFKTSEAAMSTSEHSSGELAMGELPMNDLPMNDLSAEGRSREDLSGEHIARDDFADDVSTNGDGSRNFDLADDTIACPLCRYLNRRRYRFCGRCGAKLEGAPAVDVPSKASYAPSKEAAPPAEKRSNYFAAPPSQVEPPVFGRDLNFESEPSSFRALYIGIAMVIVAFGLAYFAWTSGWIKKSNAAQAPAASDSNPVAAPQAASPDPTPGTSTLNAPVNGEVNSARPAGAKTDEATAAPAGSETAATAEKKSDAASSVVSAPAASAPIASKSAKPAPTGATSPPVAAGSGTPSAAVSLGGFEELSVARHYLNDANGGEQSRAEAARWLWKSVAKQNIDATVLLGDLYLRGEGVSKNCDQARLLLDAAAIKGRKDAAEQLRHLGAFGCQ